MGCAIPDEDGTEPEGSVLTPMGADLPLLPYCAGDVEVAITTGFAGTNAFPFEGPFSLHSFEPSRSTGNFDCTFKCGFFSSVYRCIRANGFSMHSRSVSKCIHVIAYEGSLPVHDVRVRSGLPRTNFPAGRSLRHKNQTGRIADSHEMAWDVAHFNRFQLLHMVDGPVRKLVCRRNSGKKNKRNGEQHHQEQSPSFHFRLLDPHSVCRSLPMFGAHRAGRKSTKRMDWLSRGLLSSGVPTGNPMGG